MASSLKFTPKSPFKSSNGLGTLLASLLSLALVLVFLGIWEISAQKEWIRVLFYPAPSHIGETVVDWVKSGEVWIILRPTLQRLYVGLAIGGSIGIAMGIIVGRLPLLYTLFDPIMNFLQPIPKIAILPLFYLTLGYGDRARFFIVAMTVFFPLLVNTSLAAKEINPQYFAVAKIYKTTRWQVTRQVIFPSILPYMLAGLRLGFNAGFVVAISLEIVASPDGLGHVIWRSWQTFRIADIYACLLLVGLISILNNSILTLTEKIFMPWK